MASNVGQGSESLRFPADGGVRIAASVTIKIEKESELYRNAAARGRTVPCAVAGVAARSIHVHRIESVAG